MMTLTTILAATLLAPEASAIGGMKMLPNLVGNWNGELSYRDYTSGTIESLKAAATIRLTNHGHAISADITYPGYSKDRVDSTIFGWSPQTKQWGFDQFPGQVTKSEYTPGTTPNEGSIVMTGMVTEQVGKEMKEVPCRMTVSLKGSALNVVRETGSPLVMRHKFAFTRSAEGKGR